MHEPPLLVIMAKAPVCGAVNTRLAKDVGAVPATALARTLTATLLREVARDRRFRAILAISPDTALRARYPSWGAASRLKTAGGAPPHPNPLPGELALASSQPNDAASASGCGWEREQVAAVATSHLPLREKDRIRGKPDRISQGRGGLGRRMQRVFERCGRGSLGQRMQRIFDRCGRGPLIIVGTDIPFITCEIIAEAFRQLRRADAVFGRAEDGGYWLVGLRRRPKRLSPFENVRWSSPHALSDTVKNLRSRRIAFAATLFDIDTQADYRRYLRARGAASETA